jgi:hypothetical protein
MKSYIFVLTIVLIILGISACNTMRQDPTLVNQISSRSETSPTKAASATPEPTSAPKHPDAELISINTEWNQYINYRLGFSMNVPSSMYLADASCYWNENGDYSYRPEAGKAPVVVIEGDDRVYITSKYEVVLTQATQIPAEKGYRYKYGGCEWLENDLELVENRDYSSYIWEIAFREIESNNDLELLIDDYYGECFRLGEVLPLEGRTYSTVKVLGDGKPVEESECLLRGGYVFLYSQELRIAATWKTGQMAHFSSLGMNEGVNDGEMLASFEFVPRFQEP